MTDDPNPCDRCASGCQARHTDERTTEETSAAPYLLVSALIIVLIALLFRWLF